MRSYKPVYWADDVDDVQNASGFPLYKVANLDWKRPTIWRKNSKYPDFDTDEPFVYALVRNHGNSSTKDRIEYIGLTNSPLRRFGNHSTAHGIVKKGGEVKFTYAPIKFVKGRNRIERIGRALEEIEHLLIWAVPDHLLNEKKMFTLPGMGKNGGNAWRIQNSGYRFSGRMPREIVYPWMLIQPGRDRSLRT